MDYAALQAKNPHWTRQPDRAELMAEQKKLVEDDHKRRLMAEQKARVRMSPAEKMALQEQKEWERMEVKRDLDELLGLLHRTGVMEVESLKPCEQVPTS